MEASKTRCDICGLAKRPLIYEGLSRKVCSYCSKKERLKEAGEKTSLIKKMMFPIDWDPPLGWHQIHTTYYRDPLKGRIAANYLFTTLRLKGSESQ